MSAPYFQQETIPAGEWYLSFDCATKSFAFALLRLRLPAHDLVLQAAKIAEMVAGGDWKAVANCVGALELATRSCFLLAGGGVADLVPGRSSKSISTIERVRAVRAYLDGPVAAALATAAAAGCPPPNSPLLNVLVEFQMGPNSSARTVATTLLANYVHANVFLVGPAYKNKLWYPSRIDLHHAHFTEKYDNRYSANKKHARALYFDHIAPIFDHDSGIILKKISPKFQSDFADAVLQVLGFRKFGNIKHAAENF